MTSTLTTKPPRQLSGRGTNPGMVQVHFNMYNQLRPCIRLLLWSNRYPISVCIHHIYRASHAQGNSHIEQVHCTDVKHVHVYMCIFLHDNPWHIQLSYHVILCLYTPLALDLYYKNTLLQANRPNPTFDIHD